jgi:phage terminase small subunit
MTDQIRPLPPKQQRFVEEYLVDLNATKAAERAGYSPKTANEQASRLMARPEIQAAIADGMAARSERTGIDAAYVLKRLHDENEADLADLYDATGALKPVREWPLVWRKGLVQGVEVEDVKADGIVMGVVRKVKLSDRIKRTELIGKHVDVQAFNEKAEIKHSGEVTVKQEWTFGTKKVQF